MYYPETHHLRTTIRGTRFVGQGSIMSMDKSAYEKLIDDSGMSRKAFTGRILRALLKKEFIIRFRRISLIFELLGACIITLTLFPIYKLARSNVGSVQHPNSTGYVDLAEDLAYFFYSPSSTTKVAVAPDNNTSTVLHDYFGIIFYIASNFIDSEYTFSVSNIIADDVSGMKEEIYKSNTNGFGIYMNTSDSIYDDVTDIINTFSDCTSNSNSSCFDNDTFISIINDTIDLIKSKSYLNDSSFNISMYKQSLYGDPDEAMLKLLLIFRTFGLYNFATERQPYPSVDYANLYDIHVSVAFLSIAPAILSAMGSGQIMLDEKENKILTYMTLMGVSEVHYYFVQFLVLFFLTLFPYIIYCFELCYWFCMVGTPVTLVLFVSTLFALSYTLFFLCIIAINQKSSNGRFLAVILAVFVMFFGYMHYFYTLHESASPVVRNIVSLIPFSAYQLTMLMFYDRCKNGYSPLTWKDLNLGIRYPISKGIMWLAVDSVIYFILFVILNLFVPRGSGVAPMRFWDIFDAGAWRRLFLGSRASTSSDRYIDDDVSAISVKGLTKRFGKILAVDDVSFDIKKGEVIVMIGPNGAGKSTIINTISVALSSDGGTMNLFNNGETTHFKDIHRYLGICFQENVLIDLLSVKEHFDIFGEICGLSREEKNATMECLGSKLQLEHVFNIRSRDLSGGQKRKLCLSLSLLGNPRIIIMDEPTAGVDVQSRQLIWKTIAGLKGSTCLITSHALEEAEAVSTRLFIVSRGKIPFMGTSTELRREYNCGYVLRVEQRMNDTRSVLDLCKKHISDAKYLDGRTDYILLPVHREIPRILEELDSRKEELGVVSYSFAIEQLEDTLLRLIQHDDA